MLFTLQCTDSVSDSQLPTVQYNFRHIADLENVEPNQLVGESTIYSVQRKVCILGVSIVGASLSEPHMNGTTLRECDICIYVGMTVIRTMSLYDWKTLTIKFTWLLHFSCPKPRPL